METAANRLRQGREWLRSSSPSAMISGVEYILPKILALKDIVHIRFGTAALCCALLVFALAPSDAQARSRESDAATGGARLAFLSESDKTETPAEEPPPPMPQQGSQNFDGQWTFTGAGCPNAGSVYAKIIGGKIFVKGGGGQVDPDGTLHSVGAGNGITLTAVGQLSGNTGSGTFNRSDGCVGHWVAVKRGNLRGRR
jgi:hypothetical protein